MRVLVNVGYQTVMLPNEQGVQQLLKILGCGKLVSDYKRSGFIALLDRDMRLEIAIVDASVKLVTEAEAKRRLETLAKAEKKGKP